jgi:hypothetical protein
MNFFIVSSFTRFSRLPRQKAPLLAAEMKNILFSANPVRDLSLSGANTEFNALCELSRQKVEDLLTESTSMAGQQCLSLDEI